MINRHKQQSEL